MCEQEGGQISVNVQSLQEIKKILWTEHVWFGVGVEGKNLFFFLKKKSVTVIVELCGGAGYFVLW